MNYKKKTEKNKGMYIVVIVFVFLASIYLIFNILDAWKKYTESKRRLESSQESYQELQVQYQNLQNLKELEESSTGYEMQVRSKFDLVKEGEKTVFITSEIIEPVIEEETRIKKFLNIFKNIFN
jgi:biopolymer transport protein ExbB/TolQ